MPLVMAQARRLMRFETSEKDLYTLAFAYRKNDTISNMLLTKYEKNIGDGLLRTIRPGYS
jgi:hypothetical protein